MLGIHAIPETQICARHIPSHTSAHACLVVHVCAYVRACVCTCVWVHDEGMSWGSVGTDTETLLMPPCTTATIVSCPAHAGCLLEDDVGPSLGAAVGCRPSSWQTLRCVLSTSNYVQSSASIHQHRHHHHSPRPFSSSHRIRFDVWSDLLSIAGMVSQKLRIVHSA